MNFVLPAHIIKLNLFICYLDKIYDKKLQDLQESLQFSQNMCPAFYYRELLIVMTSLLVYQARPVTSTIKVNSETKTHATINHSLTLDCPLSDNDETVVWTLNNATINITGNERVTFGGKRFQRLEIARVFKNDSGAYACTISVGKNIKLHTFYVVAYSK